MSCPCVVPLFQDQGGMTLLHVAARRGHNEIIRILLDSKRFDVNQKVSNGVKMTFLCSIIENEIQFEKVKLRSSYFQLFWFRIPDKLNFSHWPGSLVGKCSCHYTLIWFQDDGGWTAIMWAAEDKMVETAKLLLQRGGNVHLRDLVNRGFY